MLGDLKLSDKSNACSEPRYNVSNMSLGDQKLSGGGFVCCQPWYSVAYRICCNLMFHMDISTDKQ